MGYESLLRALRSRKGLRYRGAIEQHGRFDANAFGRDSINEDPARIAG